MSDHMSEGMIVCTECGELVPSIEVWPVAGERSWQPQHGSSMHKAECSYAKPVELNRTYEEIEYMERLSEDLDRHDAKEREEYDRLTITAAIDLVNDHAVAHTEDLLKVARIGQMLFSQAVYTADEQDNTEFFVKAFEEWPDEVTQLMEKMQLSFGVEERDQSTGERTGRSRWEEHYQ